MTSLTQDALTQDDDVDLLQRGSLFKRKDFLGKELAAKSHPNRHFYYRRDVNVTSLIASCTKKLRDEPRNTKALFIRASSYMKQQPDYPANYPAAIKDYSAILEIDPKSIEALYNRAVAHEKLGRTADAVIGYTAVLEADPNHVNAAYARRL